MTTLEQIQAITELAYKISTETEHDVFVSYSPHVQTVSVRIFMGGWNDSAPENEYLDCDLTGNRSSEYYDSPEDAIDWLRKLYENNLLLKKSEQTEKESKAEE